MKTITTVAIATLSLAALFTAAGVQAQTTMDPGKTGAMGTAEAKKDAAGATDMTEGEIRKVDKDAKKITIKHGEIKNLEMPAMTMVFQVKDPAVLDKVKAGDKVRFKVEKTGTAFVVTDIQSVK
ncbi:MAG: copper-binding protein [Burkholderiaceae bacterium]